MNGDRDHVKRSSGGGPDNSINDSKKRRFRQLGLGTQEELVPLKDDPSNGGGEDRYLPYNTSDDRLSPKEKWIGRVAIVASLLSILLCAIALIGFGVGVWEAAAASSAQQKQQQEEEASKARLPSQTQGILERLKTYTDAFYDHKGRFVLEDYDVKPTFSNFLPGLAGYYGKPLYAFYVNRGQGVASFGVKSKDFPIQEFHSANLAYQSTQYTGFRTFLQIARGNNKRTKLIEPFGVQTSRFPDEMSSSSDNISDKPKRYMYIGSNEMQIQEIDSANGIETNVSYFILPEEDFGAFVKRTTVTNIQGKDFLGRGSPLKLSMLDGLAKMEPAGGKLMNRLLKSMGRTLEGFMGVYSPYDDTNQMPYYRLSMPPSDTASVTVQEAGHWCLSILEESLTDPRKRPEPILLPIVHDPAKVFDDDTSLLRPVHLYSHSIDDMVRKEQQYGSAKTASAFAALETTTLKTGESLTVSTFFGKSANVMHVPVVARRLLQSGFVLFKERRASELVQQITEAVQTKTANPLFDGHVQQMFLDNALRGGIPSVLGDVDDDAKLRNADEDARLKVYHLFSRIHGDLERDYNDFVIEPTFFSQGPGNFRDVAQNRRSDVLFEPRIGSFNVRHFLSFIQADGYNPLSVEAIVFTIQSIEDCKQIALHAVGAADGHRAQREALAGILNSGPFRPGQLFLLMEEQNIELIISRQEFIDIVAAASHTHPMAVFKDGYWADHWTYYVDLIDSYLSVYPDWEKRILFEIKLPYFFSPVSVQPRERKYVLSLTYDGKSYHVRQLNATKLDKDDKLFQSQFIKNTTGWYDLEADLQHDADGIIFESSPIEKLFLLATIKFALRDPYGVGILYEGGKPGWDDANNGLVGMIGSGMPEVYELAVLLRYILSAVDRFKQDLVVPEELDDLIQTIKGALETLTSIYTDGNILYPRVPKPLFNYWDAVATALETYRARTKVTFTGKTRRLRNHLVVDTLQKWLNEVQRGIDRGLKLASRGHGDDGTTGITPTYFSYNVTKWKKTGAVNAFGHNFVRATEMIVCPFPLFLEGPTRMMKSLTTSSEAKEIYEKVRASPLRDEALRMYLISASLKGQSFDMGREMAFAPGWLENQSVWLHMSYKFYLELLRNEMYSEFYEEMTSGGMLPFMEPSVYGRSLMECSSFLASSAFEDPAKHGRGYLARLSGSTSEFLSMWVLMFIGPKPFFVEERTGKLRMQLLPALPRWMFDDSNGGNPQVSFKLFGSIDVTYYHEGGGDSDLFRVAPYKYKIVSRDGTIYHISGSSIDPVLADKIRRVVFVASIEAYFQ